MRTFLVIWVGQFVSMIGSGLTGFALSVYVFTTNNSVTDFALILLANQLPGMLLSPVAGALVDRWNRKWVLIGADALAACFTVLLWFILRHGELEIWHVYLVSTGIATLNAFQIPAYSATVTTLVPKESLSRAAGMGELSSAISQIVTPVLGGALLGIIHLQGIIALDVGTFLIAAATLFISTIPAAKVSAAGKASRGKLLQEAGYGWRYIRERPGLFSLLVFFAAVNFLTGLVTVLATPLILSFADEQTLGALLTFGGLGMLAGSLLVTLWTPKRLMPVLFGAQGIAATAILLFGLRESVVLLGASIFLYLFATPVILSMSQALWQRKVPADIQGKVFSMRRLVAWSMLPLAYLSAGPLSDGVLEPLMAEGGAWASSLGSVIGVGPGRGMAVLFLVTGTLTLVATALAARRPELRTLEVDLEDAQ